MENRSTFVFSCGNTLFGIKASAVVEVVLHSYISAQDHKSDSFCGSVNIRGRKVGVLCAAERLGVDVCVKGGHGNVLLIRDENINQGKLFGLIVNSVIGCLQYSSKEVMHFSSFASSIKKQQLIDGVVLLENDPIYLLKNELFLGVNSDVNAELFSVFSVA